MVLNFFLKIKDMLFRKEMGSEEEMASKQRKKRLKKKRRKQQALQQNQTNTKKEVPNKNVESKQTVSRVNRPQTEEKKVTSYGYSEQRDMQMYYCQETKMFYAFENRLFDNKHPETRKSMIFSGVQKIKVKR